MGFTKRRKQPHLARVNAAPEKLNLQKVEPKAAPKKSAKRKK